MIKSINMMKSKRNNIVGHAITHVIQFISCPTGIARRAALVFALMIAVVGNICAQEVPTWQEHDKFNGTTVTLYAKENVITYSKDFYSIVKSHLSDITHEKAFIRWNLYKSTDNNFVAFDQNNNTIPQITFNKCSSAYQYQNNNTYIICYKAWADFSIEDAFDFKFSPNNNSLKDCVLECYVTDEYTEDNVQYGNLKVEPAYKLKISVVFNEEGAKPDNFVKKYQGEISYKEQEVTGTERETSPDFKELQSPNKYVYARFYLTKGGDLLEDDTNINNIKIISSKDAQHSNERKDRGYYLYNSDGLTTDNLDIKVNLNAGEFYDYQLVALFSKQAPTLTNNTITQEPEIDAKVVYSFTRPFGGKLSDNAKKYQKQIIVPTGNSCEIQLNKYLADILTDYQKTDAKELIENLHLRWYVTYDGQRINNQEDILEPLQKSNNNSTIHRKKIGYGYFWNSNLNKDQWGNKYDYENDINAILNIKFTPNLYGAFDDWTKYQLHVVMTNDVSEENGQIISDGEIIVEPQNMNMEYVFNFVSPKVVDKYLKWTLSSAKFDVSDLPTLLDTDINTLKENYSIKWYVLDNKGNTSSFGNNTGWTFVANNNSIWPFSDASGNYIYIDLTNKSNMGEGNDLATRWGESSWNINAPTISYNNGNFENVATYSVVCEASTELNDALHAVKYIFHFNERGIEPDDFVSYYDGEPIFLEREVAKTSKQEVIDFSDIKTHFPDLGEVKYVRYYLQQNGALVDISSQAIKVVDGKTTDRARRGVYVYNPNASLTEEQLKVTLSLDPEKFYNYQLVAVFSNGEDITTGDGNSVTKEPKIKGQIIYSFIKPFAGILSQNAFRHEKNIFWAMGRKDYTIQLADEIQTILSEYKKESFEKLIESFHLRWFVTYDGKMVDKQEDVLELIQPSNTSNKLKDGYGYYWNTKTKNQYANDDINSILNIKFTPDIEQKSLGKYQVHVVMSDDVSEENGQIQANNELTCEPYNLNMEYVFNISCNFVHSKGASGRDYIIGANVSAKQKTWNEETQSADDINGDIRQGVHTWNYNVYVETDAKHQLSLPLQYYNKTGQNLEPRAYFRWYDWKTDYAVVSDDNSFTFFKSGSLLSSMEEFYVGGDGTLRECDRGLMAINISQNACQNLIGTEIMAKNGFETYYRNHGSLDIACDVSKYTDGLDGQVLIHEPTLSTRYIYHVYPASVIADNIAVGNAALQNGLGNIANGSSLFKETNNGMFKLFEDKSRVAVSLGGNSSQFSLRLDEFTLDNYFVWENPTEKTGLTKCTKVSWWVYYEKDGNLCKKQIKDSEARIETFTKSDIFEQGVERFHVVAYVGNDAMDIENDQGVYAAVTHYELTFVDAAPLTLDELRNSQNIKRTEEYMNVHYQWANALTFDGDREEVADRPQQYYSTTDMYAKPNLTIENMSCEPIEWNEVNYGYCYPQLSKNINDGWPEIGMSPLHGDYMILKSMNVDGISSSGDDEYPLKWWNDGILYDYTHSYKDNNKYGAFMYVDASDETRTLAQMPLKNARLCVGSTIYFTFVVADMTGSNANPQILARVSAKIGGRTVPIVAFHSGEITGNRGKWVQVYGKATIPGSVLDDIQKINPTLSLSAVKDFEVQIINYANDTEGADYAIDQLSFWFGTSKLNVSQNNGDCDDNVNNKLKAYMTGESLHGLLGENKQDKIIYYRICETATNEVVKGKNMYPRLNDTYESDEGQGDDGNHTYGEVYVKTTDYKSNVLPESEMTQQSGFFKDANDEVYFRLFNRFFTGLQEGKKYYISIYDTTLDKFDETLANSWGNGSTNPCSTYSADFVPLRPYLSIAREGETDEISVIEGECGGNGDKTVTLDVTFKMPDETSPTGYKLVKPHYDYFKGTKEEYLAIKNLMEALDDFRDWDKQINHGSDEDYTNYTTGNLEAALETYKAAGGENAQIYAEVIEDNKQKLLLSGSKQFIASLENGTNMFVADAIEAQIENVTVCAYTTFAIDYTTSAGGPTLQLGFEDVTTYPENYVRVVRVGKEQMDNLQKEEGGFLLHVPVHTFKTGDTATENTGTLAVVGDLELLKKGTTDPTITIPDNNVEKIATFVNPTVSSDKMYVSLNFHGEGVTKPTFHEGFAYRMYFQVANVKDDGTADESSCMGNVEFVLKIVPEFVTWTGEAGNTNTNWNNDENWTRSKCEELHKTIENTGTPAHPNGYSDNDENLGQPDTYVPMKFTYVTMPRKNRAPKLIGLTTDGDGIYNNIGNDIGNEATKNIQYDMMVRYTEKTCIDHGETGNIYDCEKFYGNWCKEIYFKPEAELVNQQHLTYEKAWVEKELVPAKWYLMSSPLKATYAGDMYVPKSNGRQETEAFQPITFGNGYSRTKYPIYQRSWGIDAKVYTKTNDYRAESYDAKLPYPTFVDMTMAEWSHTYNDVQVPYSDLKGFSIRAHKQEQGDNLALIRLPKADTEYSYYDWNDKQKNEDYIKHSVNKENIGRFITDDADGTDADGNVEVTITGTQNQQGYVLIGNPYVASVDMVKFFSGNTNAISSKGYWTYENGNLATHEGTGIIHPLQAFFVKVNNDATTIKFTPEMMVDGNPSQGDTPNSAPTLHMTAKSESGQSTAKVMAAAEASTDFADGEDVETFFDSNFSHVPTIYTVAGTKAVSINAVPEIDVVPFGVTCAGNETVDVTITGTDMVAQPLYVYDASNGTFTEMRDGEPISVQPNDYGRYYLTTRSSTSIGENRVQGIVISVRDGQVTVTAADNIGNVYVTALNGNRVLSLTDCGTLATFNLHQGLYVIETEGEAGKQTVKIMVK